MTVQLERRADTTAALNAVLTVLEAHSEWDSQTLNDLAWVLEHAGYARTNRNGKFVAVRPTERDDHYAAGWEAGRRAGLREARERR